MGSGPPTASAAGFRRSLWILLAGNALTEIGIGFFLPILPLFIGSRGGSALLVGVIFATGMVGYGSAQYPGGWASDRFGRRRVIILSLATYGILFLVYLAPLPVWALVPVRFVHAFVAGFFGPAAAALVADLTTPAQRGWAYGQLRASSMVGTVIGPVLGGVVAVFRLDAIFAAGALLCLAATVMMLQLPAVPRIADLGAEPPRAPLQLLRRLVPVLLLAGPIYYVFGTYDAIWSLYITGRGATTVQVGLSFAVYALPIVLLGGTIGRLSDRLGYRRPAALTITTYGILNGVYPLIANVPALILIGFGEGALTVAGQPALNAEVSRAAPPGQQGRTQGIYGLAVNAVQVLGAVAGGALYTIRPAFAFWAGTAICLLGVALSLIIWSRSVRGSPPDRQS